MNTFNTTFTHHPEDYGQIFFLFLFVCTVANYIITQDMTREQYQWHAEYRLV